MGGNAVLTFWIGYILTRPFGAALGDLLTQAKTYGGLGMGAMWTSALFLSVIVMLVAVAQIGMNGRRSAQPPNNPLPNFKEKSCSSALNRSPVAAVSAVLVALATGCSKPADQGAQAPHLHRLPMPALSQGKAASKLGD
jgi:predicted lipid-binding transport protein (Tim44 family)